MPPKKLKTNAATLIDLKAELVRRQQDSKSKSKNTDAGITTKFTSSGAVFIGHKSNILQKKANDEKQARIEKSRERAADAEQREKEYTLSQAQLKRKAALYDKLKSNEYVPNSSDEDESDGRYLVDFNRKRGHSSSSNDDVDKSIPESMRQVYAPEPSTKIQERYSPEPTIFTDRTATPPPLQSDVHYQHVSNDDARELGVAYYRFSADEAQRKEQLAELNRLRQQTQSTREAEEKVKERREQLMAARLAKIREKRGLPPEKPPEPETIPLPEELIESKEELDRKKLEEEIRANKRANHVRPWDKDKSLNPQDESTSTFSQRDWVKKNREERNPEFAPPSSYNR